MLNVVRGVWKIQTVLCVMLEIKMQKKVCKEKDHQLASLFKRITTTNFEKKYKSLRCPPYISKRISLGFHF